MPVLKTYKNGAWEPVSSMSGMADGGNADTLDGKHANEFALATDVEELNTKVGDTSVSEQISAACANVLPTVTTNNNGAFLRVVNGT